MLKNLVGQNSDSNKSGQANGGDAPPGFGIKFWHRLCLGDGDYTVNGHKFVKKRHLGIVLTAPFEVHLPEKTRPVQPDVIFIKADNRPAAGAQVFAGAPDLIVEVLSPSRCFSVVKYYAQLDVNFALTDIAP